MLLRQIFEPKLAQNAYLVGCQRTGEALLIDPLRDIDRYLEMARQEDLRVTAVAETHIHADFLSGARELAEKTGAKLYLSDEGDADWKYEWAKAGDYDVHFLKDGDTFAIGGIEIRALYTPGHTPEHMSYLITDKGSGASEPIGIASGDFVFVGDLGRPDLLETAAGVVGQREPSARILFSSIDRLLELPDFVQVWPGHGAGSACGKALGAVPSSTVGYERRQNAAIDAARRGEEDFVESILSGQPEPPLYFATMKRLNKEGPPVLGTLPEAPRLEVDAFQARRAESGTVVIDTRLDRRAFMSGHLRGSLYAPLDRSFPTIVGSYVRPEERILLIVEASRVEAAIRDLIRIGFDHFVGFIEPGELEDPAFAGEMEEIPVIDFAALETKREQAGVTVLDVRGAGEFASRAIPDARNIAHTRLLARRGELPTDQEWLVHCRSGARAAAAAALLAREGHRVVYVDDLFSRWNPKAA